MHVRGGTFIAPEINFHLAFTDSGAIWISEEIKMDRTGSHARGSPHVITGNKSGKISRGVEPRRGDLSFIVLEPTLCVLL